mgnify:CR=1 FL=1
MRTYIPPSGTTNSTQELIKHVLLSLVEHAPACTDISEPYVHCRPGPNNTETFIPSGHLPPKVLKQAIRVKLSAVSLKELS